MREQPEKWYDPDFDRDLIVQSISKQYGILPAAQEELSYSEWAVLLSGIMEDTPLGRVVLIRKENDKERLKGFTPYEHRIRNEWRSRMAAAKITENRKPEDFSTMFEKMFEKMFG